MTGSWRRARDLGCGDHEVYLDFEMRRVRCTACGVKKERLSFLSAQPQYTADSHGRSAAFAAS